MLPNIFNPNKKISRNFHSLLIDSLNGLVVGTSSSCKLLFGNIWHADMNRFAIPVQDQGIIALYKTNIPLHFGQIE